MRTHLVTEHRQNPDNLTALLSLQLAHSVISFHYFGWLNEHGLARRRLIVNDTPNTFLQIGSYRNHQTAVTQRRRHILVNQSVLLSCMQYSI